VTPALQKVKAALRKVRPELPPRKVTPGASLVADLGIDSLAFAELSLALEDAFGRPIFLGDVLADLDDPASLTVGQLASRLAKGD
jgi:acyl carrier protein